VIGDAELEALAEHGADVVGVLLAEIIEKAEFQVAFVLLKGRGKEFGEKLRHVLAVFLSRAKDEARLERVCRWFEKLGDQADQLVRVGTAHFGGLRGGGELSV